MMKTSKIYVLCPDEDTPIGGVKQLYRHVDILNKNGFSAFILHSKKGFRCTWFENDTKIAYKSNPQEEQAPKQNVETSMNDQAKIDKDDYVCVPEACGPNIANIEKGVKKVIMNQNPFLTFVFYPRDNSKTKIAYLDKDIIATIVFSEHSVNYMKYIFPQLRLFRVHYGFDPRLFSYYPHKKKQIAFIPRKLRNDATQIINILKARGALKGFKLVEINEMEEKKVGEILKESSIFFSFGKQEGFGMPSAEAMACGCIVIGYDGGGGKEFFKEEFCYPIRYGDLISFAKTAEKVIEEYDRNKEIFLEKGRKASEFILTTYSLEREEEEIVRVWKKILKEKT